jgi:nucleotide-binding universal stress UspA family protein
MKILACTDGSGNSQKALEEAAKIAGGCNADEVAIIHVYENFLTYYSEAPSISEIERFSELENERKEERKKILSEALKFFEAKNIKASTIFKEGHPSEVITSVASEGGFDMIVIGSRGLGGLKKLFLGSISAAVVHEANTNVLTVK